MSTVLEDEVVVEGSVDEAAMIASIRRGTPLTDVQLDFVLNRAGVTELGKTFVRQVRKSPPETAPRSSREVGNTVGRVPMSLTNRVLQFGSIFPELCAVYYVASGLTSPDVLAFYNRISIPRVDVIGEDGRRVGVVFHPVQGLCIELNRSYFIELRRESDLEGDKLFKKREDGTWHAPTIEAAAARYGIGHQLILDKELGRYISGNLSYVSGCYFDDYVPASAEEVEAVVKEVRRKRVLNRKVLIEKIGHKARAVKQAIAEGNVYFPFFEMDLTNTEITFLYANRDEYLAHKLERQVQGAMAPPKMRMLPVEGQSFTWDGRPCSVVNAGKTFYSVTGNRGLIDVPLIDVRRYCDEGTWLYEPIAEPRVTTVSDKRRAEALALYEMRNLPYQDWKWPYGKKRGRPVSIKTIQRTLTAIRKADIAGESPIEYLVRDYDNCGPRESRFVEEYAVWERCLNEHFLTSRKPTVTSVAGIYRRLCDEQGISYVSAETIRRRIKKLDTAVIVREQDGTYAAYQWGNFVPHDKANLLIKGRLPLEVAHIDHTPIPVVLRCSVTNKVSTVMAWRTMLCDACSYRVIAHVTYYGSPSYEALYRLLIEARRRNFGRLPQYIVCDRALEFKSRQWRSVLGRYGIVLLTRPARRPRHGQPIESRNFKDLVEIFKNLDGYRKPEVDYRVLKGEFSPKANAIYTLSDIRRLLDKHHYETEPSHPSSRTGAETIDEFEHRILSQADDSHVRMISDNEEFRMLCMPEVDGGGMRVVNRQGSVLAMGLEYFAPEFADANVVGKRVAVHYDPDNIGRVFAWVVSRWVECHANCYQVLSQFTHYERLDYQDYLKGAGIEKAPAKAKKAEAVAMELEAARQTARGRQARAIAQENMGEDAERDGESPSTAKAESRPRQPASDVHADSPNASPADHESREAAVDAMDVTEAPEYAAYEDLA